MSFERCPSGGVRPSLMSSNWQRYELPFCKNPPSMDSALNCGRASVWGLSSNVCTPCASVRLKSGASWAPKGQTPIIQFHFNWNHVSVIAWLTRTNCLFRLHEGSIKKEEIVEFLKALKAHLKQPLLVIWDGLKAHRSRLVREYLDSLGGSIQIAFLPPYAPDLNPVEHLWAWLKPHALANYCSNDLSEQAVRATFIRVEYRICFTGRKGVGVEPTRHAKRASPDLKSGRSTGIRSPSVYLP